MGLGGGMEAGLEGASACSRAYYHPPPQGLPHYQPPPPRPDLYMHSCSTPPLTKHQPLFPKRIRFVLTGVTFRRYSKLSVILMISLRGRDRKMNSFSLSFSHNCKRERESWYRCMQKRGFDWANVITQKEIKPVNERPFHSVSPSSLLPFLYYEVF